MRAKQKGSRGSVALGYIGVSLLLAVALGGWYATRHHYNHSASVPACVPANLHLSVGTTNNTAGAEHVHLVIANQGNVSCAVAGFPAVFLTDANNNPIGTGAGLSTLNATQTINLAPGQAAHVSVNFPDHNDFTTPGTCSSVATNVELYLPATASGLIAPFAEYNCPGFTTTVFATGQ